MNSFIHENAEKLVKGKKMFNKNKSFILQKDESQSVVSNEFHLEQNIPNPFSIKTTISFSVPMQCKIRLIVYCRLEEPVLVLYDGLISPGNYFITWNGKDSDGQRLKIGSYVYYLEAESFVASRKLNIKKLNI